MVLQIEYSRELTAADRELVEAARKAVEQAHAPFTDFRVGAAVRLSDGQILTSSNFESPIGTLSICAERRLLYAVPNGARVQAMAIVSQAAEECYPCGVCRQAMVEHNPRMRVIMAGADTATITQASDLLPFTYSYGDTL